MAVHLAISNIKIESASASGHSKMDRANITVTVNWDSRSPLELGLFVVNYQSIDSAIEEARLLIVQFAEDLKEAASRPLAGSKQIP